MGIYGAMKRHMIGFGTLVAASLAGPILAAEPVAVAQFEDWAVFRDSDSGKALCYIGSLPKTAEGKYTARGRHYVVVAVRPEESSRGVVTIEAGYPYQAQSRVAITIDGDKEFDLFTRNRKADGKGDAWADDDKEDSALVAAMKAGRSMVVKGTSSRGTLTTDTYSLSGFTRAYQAMIQACGTG